MYRARTQFAAPRTGGKLSASIPDPSSPAPRTRRSTISPQCAASDGRPSRLQGPVAGVTSTARHGYRSRLGRCAGARNRRSEVRHPEGPQPRCGPDRGTRLCVEDALGRPVAGRSAHRPPDRRESDIPRDGFAAAGLGAAGARRSSRESPLFHVRPARPRCSPQSAPEAGGDATQMSWSPEINRSTSAWSL